MSPSANWLSKILFPEPKWKYTVLHSCGVKQRQNKLHFYRYIYKYKWDGYVNILSTLATCSGCRKCKEALKGLLIYLHPYSLPILKDNILFSLENNFLSSENLSMPSSYLAVMGGRCLMRDYSPFVFLHGPCPASPLPCPAIPFLSLHTSPLSPSFYLLFPSHPYLSLCSSSTPSILSFIRSREKKVEERKKCFYSFRDSPVSRTGSKLLQPWRKEFHYRPHPWSANPLTERQTTK